MTMVVRAVSCVLGDFVRLVQRQNFISFHGHLLHLHLTIVRLMLIMKFTSSCGAWHAKSHYIFSQDNVNRMSSPSNGLWLQIHSRLKTVTHTEQVCTIIIQQQALLYYRPFTLRSEIQDKPRPIIHAGAILVLHFQYCSERNGWPTRSKRASDHLITCRKADREKKNRY